MGASIQHHAANGFESRDCGAQRGAGSATEKALMSVCFPSAAHRRRRCSAKPSSRERVYPALSERVAAGRPRTVEGGEVRKESRRGV